MNVDDFLESLKSEQVTRKGKLLPWKNDILKLRTKGVTYAQIVQFLELNNVKASLPGIQQFCRKHLSEQVSETCKPTPAPPASSEIKEKTTPEETIDKRKAMPSWYTGKAKSIDDLM